MPFYRIVMRVYSQEELDEQQVTGLLVDDFKKKLGARQVRGLKSIRTIIHNDNRRQMWVFVADLLVLLSFS